MCKEISMATVQIGSSEGHLALQGVVQCCSYGFAFISCVCMFLLKE